MKTFILTSLVLITFTIPVLADTMPKSTTPTSPLGTDASMGSGTATPSDIQMEKERAPMGIEQSTAPESTMDSSIHKRASPTSDEIEEEEEE